MTARLLTPYDFGLVAIGTTVLTFGTFLDDGGVGTALIRRPEPPTKSELQALVAFQFGLDLLLVVGIGLVMLPFGLLGQVTTVIVISLPLGAFRAPSYILYERRLNYRPMAIVEVVETTRLLRVGNRDDQHRLGRLGARDRVRGSCSWSDWRSSSCSYRRDESRRCRRGRRYDRCSASAFAIRPSASCRCCATKA